MTAPLPPSSEGWSLEELFAAVVPVDEDCRALSLHRHDELAKPPGSLGDLETVGAQLAAVAGRCPPPVPRAPWLLLAAADHGVHAEGVNAWPQEVTAVIAAAACRGESVAGVLAPATGASMTVLDVGLAHDPGEHPNLVRHRIRAGTRNLAVEDAMTVAEVRAAFGAGATLTTRMIRMGVDLVLLGEMGMTNTTASACLISAATGRPAAEVTGAGAGASQLTLARKLRVVEAAAGRCADRPAFEQLAAVGGLEHAALVGAMLAAAAYRTPVLLDGIVTNAAALIAVALQPQVAGYLIASHRSAEPGAAAALDALGLDPLLDLNLRLGEGSGALLAAPLVVAAAAVLAQTATLDDLAG